MKRFCCHYPVKRARERSVDTENENIFNQAFFKGKEVRFETVKLLYGSVFHELDHAGDGGVGGGQDAVLLAEGDDGAVEGLDLGALARADIL